MIKKIDILVTLYLAPNCNVDLVSDSLMEDGEQQMIIVVRAFPPVLIYKLKDVLRTVAL